MDTFVFNTSKPDLVNVDGDKILLWEKTDNKNENFIFQYKMQRPIQIERKPWIFSLEKNGRIIIGLNDKFAGLRRLTIELPSRNLPRPKSA